MAPLDDLDFLSGPLSSPPGPTFPSGRRLLMGLVGSVVLVVLLATTGRMTSLGQDLMVRFRSAATSVETMVADTTSSTTTYGSAVETAPLRTLASHPSNKLSPYLRPGADTSTAANPGVLSEFHTLLNQFAHRQTTDDNFTVRVIDRRTDEVLELYSLTDARTKYQNGSTPDWRDIDDQRGIITQKLVDKYDDKGIPREDIMVRWGRANQIANAQERDRPYRAYEVRLTQHLGLSLLPTQIGIVETFNQDELVSSVGAKSRYQMMPSLLRRRGINTYSLSTEADTSLTVEEALHPLLTLEPAFLLLKGYVNAVGHEIPGMSAYHTGPGNIYKLYRFYFTESQKFTSSSTVADAYIWAATEGFDTVREETSFGPYSRGYIPSAYGALTAQDASPLDLSETMEAVRVQLRSGTRISLDEILTALRTSGRSLNWNGPARNASTIYEQFRAYNPHLNLPASEEGTLPAGGNVQLVSTVDGKGVRFFLPLGAPEVLRNAGLDVLDPTLSFRFDQSTFSPPSEQQVTRWDEQYAALVEDIKHFGFTPSNRSELLALYDKFEELAEERPSEYRQRQLDIIRTHRRIWLSNPWDELSDLTMEVTGRTKSPVQPPVKLPVDSVGSSALELPSP